MSAVVGYLAYNLSKDDNQVGDWIISIGTAVCALVTTFPLLSINLENKHLSVNMKAWNFAALIVMLVVNLCFAAFGTGGPYYVVTVALLFCVHLYVVWRLSEIKDV